MTIRKVSSPPSGRTIVESISVRIATLILSGALAACSGGGGGGGNSAGGSGGGGDTPLTYTGKTDPAVITTTNAAQLTANILGGTEASGAVSSAAPEVQSGGVNRLQHRLTRAIRAVPAVSSSIRRLRSDPVDTTFDCDNVGSGTERIFGDVSQSGPGMLNFVWTNCLTGDTTLNGSASVTVRAFDQALGILDGTFNFVRVSLTSPTVSGTVSGPLQLLVNPADNSETTTSDLITLDSGGRMTQAAGLKVRDVFNDLAVPTSYVETITGRLYDSAEGFVDISTDLATPLTFGTLTQLFADGGQIVLTGKNNGHVRDVAVSSNVVRLDLDVDGDNTFEGTAFLNWADLTAPAAANLADTDHDGMHDSWELVNGLNPNDGSDASIDSDGDLANNLAEYRAGTDPRDPTSKP